MAFIYETKNFVVEAFDKPHVTRLDGGHIKIYPKRDYSDRTRLPPLVAIEFIRLTMAVGKAFMIAMKKQGIELMRVNYQDMGNWAFKKDEKPKFHIQIYGRAKNAKYQPYTEAVHLPDRSSGFYDKFEPLNKEDILLIKQEIEKVFRLKEFSDAAWEL